MKFDLISEFEILINKILKALYLLLSLAMRELLE